MTPNVGVQWTIRERDADRQLRDAVGPDRVIPYRPDVFVRES